ncbi:MAG: DegT/DnrJ/EryC1/StrS family aminotransferase [Chloroflexi bacterium]|nr:DegT/DnrJ/EryC1/StrS family aminotransferase [Chloroflexota bacterium]
MARVIDLRSDTVTLPSPEMREAMYRAELGDDVFGEDPTVRRLEEMAAARLGKEAAVLVTSGTMGNLVGALSHTQRGDEAIVGDQAHMLLYEVAGCAALGGLQLRPVSDVGGLPDPDAVRATVRGPNIHHPRTALICLENTHNRRSGAVSGPDEMRRVTSIARVHGIPVHLDGARIFNAAVALGIPASQLAAEVDSVTFCLSKGLAAPVGSLLCGGREYIGRARKYRKMVGGGMRQAGIIAACGIVALERMVDRLAEDHANARLLAEGLANLPGIVLDPSTIRSNIIIFEVLSPRFNATQLATRLTDEGVRCLAISPSRIRMVTHYGIVEQDIRDALAVAHRVLR